MTGVQHEHLGRDTHKSEAPMGSKTKGDSTLSRDGSAYGFDLKEYSN